MYTSVQKCFGQTCPSMGDDPDRPVTYRDFNALVQLFTEEKVKADADRKEFREFMKTTKEFMEKANAARDKADKQKKDEKERTEKALNDEKEKENNKADQGRADMKRMWEGGRVLEYMLIFLKNNQGSGHHYYYPKLVHVKAE